MKWTTSILALLLATTQAWATLWTVQATNTGAQAYSILTNATSGDTVHFNARESGLPWENTSPQNLYGATVQWNVPVGVSVTADPSAWFDGSGCTRKGFAINTNATLTGLRIVNCGAFVGGAVWSVTKEGTVVSDCILTNNSAGTQNGGAVYRVGTIANSLIYSNSAVSGGGIHTANLVTNCIISGNYSLGDGGGTYDVIKLAFSTISNNEAVSFGAGIHGGSGISTAISCRIVGNIGGAGGAGAFMAELDNCTIASNETSGGSGTGSGTRSCNAYGCTYDGNMQSGIFQNQAYNGTIANSIIPNWYADGTIITNCWTNPVTYSDSDYLPVLGWGGDDLALPSYVYYSTDLLGNSRTVGAGPDIGAVERQADTPAETIKRRNLFLATTGD